MYDYHPDLVCILFVRSHPGVFVSRRFTTLAKLSVDVSNVVSHKLSRNGLHRLIKL